MKFTNSAKQHFSILNEYKGNNQRLFRNEEKCGGFYVRAILQIVFQIDAVDEAFHCFHQSRRILRPYGLVGSIVDSMLNRIKCAPNEFQVDDKLVSGIAVWKFVDGKVHARWCGQYSLIGKNNNNISNIVYNCLNETDQRRNKRTIPPNRVANTAIVRFFILTLCSALTVQRYCN